MNASNTSLDNLISMYKWVVDDVVKNVREEFLNEGVDAHILEELKHLWESKIVNTGALARPSKHAAADPPTPAHHREAGKQTHHASPQQPPQQQQRAASHHTTPQSTTQVEVAVLPQGPRVQTSSSSSVAMASSSGQFTLPGGSPQGVAAQFIPPVMVGSNSATASGLAAAAGAQSIPMMVQVQTPQGPVMIPIQQLVALQQRQQQLMNQRQPPQQQRLPAQQLDQTDGLPPLVAASSDVGLSQKRDQESDAPKCSATQEDSPSVLPVGVAHRPTRVLVQLDGTGGVSSSEEESEENDESSDEDVEEEAGPEDDPLNSDDDAGSENNEEEGEVESTIVCQWEKVYRVKAKWKFQLKDGIMHVGGHDYVFHKASGEADW